MQNGCLYVEGYLKSRTILSKIFRVATIYALIFMGNEFNYAIN